MTQPPLTLPPAPHLPPCALIEWKQTDLAKASGVSEISIKNIEREATDPRSSTLAAPQAEFEKAGVVFLDRATRETAASA